MSTDLPPPVRAAIHAALGDPARVELADLVAEGDRSPSELQTALEMKSNLLAHHLGVLERANIVRKRRSEADRRRTYWTLVPGTLEALLPRTVRTVPRVVFVCTHNSARSQLATALWSQNSTVPATSAGTDPARTIHPRALAAARRHALPLTPMTPRRLDEVRAPGDVLIAVCDNAHEQLSPNEQRLHWSVPDPARDDTDAAFDQAVDELSRRIARVAPTFQQPIDPSTK
ncbi:arsenate reductase/protein-tyrosine-phosphatase family protein [Hoyosella subflava]|uniref:arsenate reductase/protein-tyrosine-phosphatase family protein n=1 Tax=Hoyosella subflava TaxID=639313 RepID=UPI00059C02AA|nr:ArsR family transcriptional regulator [Hoyosella subflava]